MDQQEQELNNVTNGDTENEIENGVQQKDVAFDLEKQLEYSTELDMMYANNERRQSRISRISRISRKSSIELRQSRISRKSSLELRREPLHILLQPEPVIREGSERDIVEKKPDSTKSLGRKRILLRSICLNPRYSLRTQLMLSFGTVSAITIIFVVVICVAVLLNNGQNLKSINQESFESLVSDIEGTTARYLAELFEERTPNGAIRVLCEGVRDRFAGYPNDSDDFVPFYDIYSQTNKYPVIGKPLPLDWQIVPNVNEDNHEEHIQTRRSLYFGIEPDISTANAFYVMQGMCDPSVTNPSDFTYWENCTVANNDIVTGGVVNPSPTNEQIYRKSSDLSPILKAIFEYEQDIRDLGVYFANSGAGATVSFPHYRLRTNSTYVSIGCEWMKERNPYDSSKPIGTQEQINRCHPNGTIVSAREYNPLERAWCKNQALNPERVLLEGPYINAWNNNDQWLLSVGKGVYDRVTNEFISCTYAGFSLERLEEILRDSKVSPNSELSVIKRDDEGTVVASTRWNSSASATIVSIDQLNIGITYDSYRELKSLVDYDEEWDPLELQAIYKKYTSRNKSFLAASYPMPPIPESYDPVYRPLYFIIVSTAEKDVFQVVEHVNTDVDGHVNEAMYLSLIVGVSGLVVVLLIVIMMSNAVTAPLKTMNTAADDIVNKFCDEKTSGKKIEGVAGQRGPWCTPKTELNELVKEFDKMVASFSGASASIAKSVKGDVTEIANQFEMQEDFVDLYTSRKEDFNYNVESFATESEEQENEENNDEVNEIRHFGSNLIVSPANFNPIRTSIGHATKMEICCTSPLFFWTVLLIATPLLLTTIALSAAMLFTISKEFDHSVKAAEAFYVEVELESLAVSVKLRANMSSHLTAKSARDHHVLARYSSWLLFDGVDRAESFTDMRSFANVCKTFEYGECPVEGVCDCAWNDKVAAKCYNYSFDTRYHQKIGFIVESHDTAPNGDRNATSFPSVSYSPSSTAWWDNVTTLPGFEKGALASGYETTYDRLRVSSALPVFPVLYNYDLLKENFLGSFISFEADGSTLGFGGCGTGSILAPHWVSSEASSQLRPELCPVGKFGYDARCRPWYDTGMKLYEASGTYLYLTPPYPFSTDIIIGQSISSPLIDPRTEEHIGQVLTDFASQSIHHNLNNGSTPLTEGGFPFLIATRPDSFNADTVIAPGFSISDAAKPISQLVLPNDQNCTTDVCESHIRQFQEIVESMKKGESGNVNFSRTTDTGFEETVYMAYAPVELKGYRPLDSSDFSRGVETQNYVTYSLALAETEEGLLKPFRRIEEDTRNHLKVAVAILCTVIFLSIVFVVYISNIATMSIAEPMLFLLELTRCINRLDVDEEPPKVDRSIGSREIIGVFDTMETLYKVVRCGNAAYFAGNLEKACVVLKEALRLFQRLDNRKAISVASNNLGNLMLSVYRTMDDKGEDRLFGMTRREVIRKGTAYFHDAIHLGEKAYDEFMDLEGWSPNCLDFMQHLSNRYFNRAMFLLSVKDGHEQPDELERLGVRDLEIARDMDLEIIEQGEEAGWGQVKRVEKVFDVALVRARGHLLLQEMGYPDDWEIGELLDNTFANLKKEAKNNKSGLFDDVTAVGRLQVLETELIRYKLLREDLRVAAQIAIRMLFEDEYTFPDAQLQAAEALIAYIDQMGLDEDTVEERKLELMSFQNSLTTILDDIDRTRLSVAIEQSEELVAVKRALDKSNSRRSMSNRGSISNRWSLRETRRRDVIMEDF